MIKINGELWRVRLVPPSHPFLTAYRHTPAIGCCDSLSRTICISNALNPIMIKKVLCHELVHATMYSYRINLSHYEEELAAELISTYGDEILALTNIVYDKFKIV